jgi:serine/threonine protein kinase
MFAGHKILEFGYSHDRQVFSLGKRLGISMVGDDYEWLHNGWRTGSCAKILRSDVDVNRLRRDLRVASNICHANVVQYELLETRDLVMLIMPCAAHSLPDRLTSLDVDQQLTFWSTVKMFMYIADAVRVAHVRGMLHCDINPTNILFVENQYMLAGFGLASLLLQPAKDGDGDGKHKKPSTFKAISSVFVPPEVRAGGDYREPADIYSLGMVMQNVVRYSDKLAVVTSSNSNDIPYLMVETLTGSMTHDDPSSRPSAREVVASLHSIVHKYCRETCACVDETKENALKELAKHMAAAKDQFEEVANEHHILFKKCEMGRAAVVLKVNRTKNFYDDDDDIEEEIKDMRIAKVQCSVCTTRP